MEILTNFSKREQNRPRPGLPWIEMFNEDDRENFAYDVFSPEGIYLKHSHIKYRLYQFKDGKAYSIIRTDEGDKVIKRFRMIE